MTKVLFLDESGDHNLVIIDKMHPIFVLGGVIAEREYAIGEMTQKLNDFKLRMFGNKEIILHTVDFTRQKNGFEKMKEREFCEEFYSGLNELIASLEIKIVACAILKEPHFEKYGFEAIDPYQLSLNVLVERFCFEVSNSPSNGRIVAETRDEFLDRQIELAFLNLKISGTKFIRGAKISREIDRLIIGKKSDNIAGLQIADAIVTPIARYLLGRKSRVDYTIIKEKFRKCDKGNIEGRGLVVLPKK